MFLNFRNNFKTSLQWLRKRIKDLNVRYHFFYVLMFLVFAFLISGLFELQIVSGRENLLAATRTSQSTQLVLPPRGLIYDQKGKVLAYNIPSYSIYLDKTIIKTDSEREVISEIAKALNVDEKRLINEYRDTAYSKDQTENEVKLVGGLTSEEYFKVVENVKEKEGLEIKAENERRYPLGNSFSHMIGYVGKPSKNELGDGVYTISRIGKDGIEKVYDEYLRGAAGIEVVQHQLEADSSDKSKLIENAFTQEEWIYGDNVYLSIDSQWQTKLADIMQERMDLVDSFASSGIVINSRTGEIKAMVSLPDYDNNLFVDAIKTDQYKNLLNDPRTPLLNRAIALQLPSGSIFKVVGATAALEENVITKDTIFRSDGCMQLSSEVRFCEADGTVLGDLNVVSALGRSSNLFFCKVAMGLNTGANGIKTTLDYARRYGLGTQTGIDLLGEQKGTLPSPELKKRLFNENWYVGDDCNSMIGQGLLTVTPLQMAVLASTISNGGSVIKPRLVDRIENQSGDIVKDFKTEIVQELDVSDETLSIIREGMRAATQQNGTAWQLNGMEGNILAKTGSADASELIGGKLYKGAHSWVMGCFDEEGENYCFVIMQQWGGRGFQTVPIVKKFIHCVQTDFASKCSEIE